MVTLDYVKSHYNEFEKDHFFDRRFSKRFIEYLPTEEWESYGFRYTGEGPFTPKEWTEENIMEDIERDVRFGYGKAVDERGISSELMAMVVNAWCKVLENGLNLEGSDGYYHINQFTIVAEHYGWTLED